jgi:predicted component of type VI protein secretion system
MTTVRIKVIDHRTRHVACDRRFTRFPVRLGRSSENEIHLDFPFISLWHVEVCESEAGGLRVQDLGSTNGLVVASERVPSGESVPLRAVLTATVGPLELCFEVEPGSRTERSSDVVVSGRDPGQGPDLELVGPDLGDPFGPELADELTGGQGTGPGLVGSVVKGELDDSLPVLPEDDLYGMRIRRVRKTVEVLRPLHAQLEASRRAWEDALVTSVRRLEGEDASRGGDAAEHDLNLLLRQFPARDRGGFGAPGPGSVNAPELAAVAQAASELLPGVRTPIDEEETRRFLARVVDVLRVFAASHIEVQHVRRRQARELGVQWEEPPDPLLAMETAEDLLRYLLDWRDAGEQRSEELVRSFSALVDHLQCYVRASLVAARRVVRSLSPAEIERGVDERWPTRASALWRHFQTCFESMMGDTYDNLTPAFRGALVEAYTQALSRAGVATRARAPMEAR